MTTVFYLSKSEKGAINSGREVEYFVTVIDVKPHTHPLYVGRCISETAAELGRGPRSGYYDNVIAIWSGGIDEQIEKNEKLVEQWEPHKTTNPVQYYDPLKKVKELTQAKEIIEKGLVTNVWN